MIAASHTAVGGFATVVEHVSDALAGLGILPRINPIEERFEKMKETCRILELHLEKLEDEFSTLYKAYRTMEEAMHGAGHEILMVSNAFADLRNHLGLQNNTSEVVYSNISVLCEDQKEAIRSFACLMKSDIVTTLHELVKYCSKAKESLKERDDKQFTYNELVQYQEKSRQRLEEIRLNGGAYDDTSLLAPIKNSARAVGSYFSDQLERIKGTDTLAMRQQKASQIEKRIDDLETAVENARRASDLSDKAMEEEMLLFERFVEEELRSTILPAILNLHKAYYEKSSARWKSSKN